ncbi:hypothetical protein IG631_09754 [Alternaria alternata]|nr:hypothetical protein IG631_09754 [Alternaria alternata]
MNVGVDLHSFTLRIRVEVEGYNQAAIPSSVLPECTAIFSADEELKSWLCTSDWEGCMCIAACPGLSLVMSRVRERERALCTAILSTDEPLRLHG